MVKKNCPFCGERRNLEVKMPLSGHFYVLCQRCGARGPVSDVADGAEERWDERDSPEPGPSIFEQVFGR